MSRFLPHPLLSCALTLMWLLLTRFSLGHLVLGSAIALFAGLAFARIEPQAPRIRAWTPLLRLVGIVSVDIVRSNWAVARLMLTNGRHGARKSGFVRIPLRLRDPVALAVLAVVLTATPGTAWLEYDPEAGTLLLHVFDMIDEAEWHALIRDRYEALLLEAFA
ncbi:Na+/H+ antiporter subunit E [Pseudorhodobacter sp. MZDSW-24AT]|uniref:Na+/H+ antiporter subunit E n=1 Tax=Pseudorhodobacter sp. MZDSW-24AT TaxID=2052957 RepID=UPI000C1E4998|nr:Na+/H+ antiporter subunit E [Pseudorhodobacter sp. MZDSW-24AT]PJF11288.1 Na+/H+ antiporter subunit E [Pseudorhodobacter sp. MZDSW-24AT]